MFTGNWQETGGSGVQTVRWQGGALGSGRLHKLMACVSKLITSTDPINPAKEMDSRREAAHQ